MAYFKDIQQPKHYKSIKLTHVNVKLLYLIIHCQIKLINGQVTKRWSVDLKSEQNTH
jgi:hypothetical protein